MVIIGLTYHRNGVAGAGYYVAKLKFKGDGRTYNATAVVFSRKEHVAITADDGATSFRCEDFEQELRTFIESTAGQRMAFPHAMETA